MYADKYLHMSINVFRFLKNKGWQGIVRLDSNKLTVKKQVYPEFRETWLNGKKKTSEKRWPTAGYDTNEEWKNRWRIPSWTAW